MGGHGATRRRLCRRRGWTAQLLDRDEVCRLEPSLSPEAVIGALYHANEGDLNPFKLVHAYALRGREHGLEVRTHTEVTKVCVEDGRVTGVDDSWPSGRTAPGRTPTADWVVLAAGAWAQRLAQTAGVGPAAALGPRRGTHHRIIAAADPERDQQRGLF